MKNLIEIKNMSDEQLDNYIREELSFHGDTFDGNIQHHKFNMSGYYFLHNQEILKKFSHLDIFENGYNNNMLVILFYKGWCKVKFNINDGKECVILDLETEKGTIEIIRIILRVMLFEGSFSNKNHPINNYNYKIVDGF